MAAELVINAASHETRIALIENGTIAELHIEPPVISVVTEITTIAGAGQDRLLLIDAYSYEISVIT